MWPHHLVALAALQRPTRLVKATPHISAAALSEHALGLAQSPLRARPPRHDAPALHTARPLYPRAPPPLARAELSLTELLKQYGVIALLFHFSVWSTALVATFSALTLLPSSEIVSFLSSFPTEIAQRADMATGTVGRIALTLALVEVIGPARLALTVAVTPVISERVRRIAVVRRLEERVGGALSRIVSRLPGSTRKDD